MDIFRLDDLLFVIGAQHITNMTVTLTNSLQGRIQTLESTYRSTWGSSWGRTLITGTKNNEGDVDMTGMMGPQGHRLWETAAPQYGIPSQKEGEPL